MTRASDPPPWPDATALLASMQSGERSSAEIVREHLDRIDAQRPRLNATTDVLRAEALAAAANPKPGPLSGLPMTLKETFGLAGREITAGSLRMLPEKPARDAPVVQRLKAAGAIIIARSTVPEFVMTGETRSLRWGVTNNPIDPAHVSGGSTGGEGALVGSGCSPAGLGTDILGSIRLPACFCGIVGFRPASDRVDKTGVWTSGVGFFESWNGIGPMTRSVRDARLIYDVIAREPLAAPASVSGVRLVIPESYPYALRDTEVSGALQLGARALLDAGMAHEEHAFDDVPGMFLNIPRLIAGEAIPAWKQWLTTADGKPFRTRQEILRQLARRPTVEPGFFTWFLMERIMKPRGDGLDRIVQMYEDARAKYHELLGSDGVLILPTVGMLAPKHKRMNLLSLRPGLNRLFTAHTFANYINLSAITVPAPVCRHKENGLVPGVMLACAPGAEARLLDAATVLEAGLR